MSLVSHETSRRIAWIMDEVRRQLGVQFDTDLVQDTPL